jgi:hypothetical protein
LGITLNIGFNAGENQEKYSKMQVIGRSKRILTPSQMAGMGESKTERDRESETQETVEEQMKGRVIGEVGDYFSPRRGAQLPYDIPRDRPLVLLIRVRV